jgi:hypothetical protein
MFKRIFEKLSGEKRPEVEMQTSAIEAVYQELEKYELLYRAAGVDLRFRRIASEQVVSDLHNLSGHVPTTVQLVRVLQQSQVARGIADAIDTDLIEDGKRMVQSAREQYQSAKMFCDEIISLSETGNISDNPRVANFLLEQFSEILLGWGAYQDKICQAFER